MEPSNKYNKKTNNKDVGVFGQILSQIYPTKQTTDKAES